MTVATSLIGAPALATEPFPFFVSHESFSPDVIEEMISLLRDGLPWEDRSGDFFRTWRVELQSNDFAAPVGFLRRDFLKALRDDVAALFGVELSDDFQVLAHRMTAGQRIGIHNDNPGLGYEAFRIVTQLTVGFGAEHGGALLLHRGPDADDVFERIPPSRNMSFGFEMGERSFHSVEPVGSDVRDAVIFNFWHRGNTPQVERKIRSLVAAAASHSPETICLRALLETNLGSDRRADATIEAACIAHEVARVVATDDSVALLAGLWTAQTTLAGDHDAAWAAEHGPLGPIRGLLPLTACSRGGASSLDAEQRIAAATILVAGWIAELHSLKFKWRRWQDVRDLLLMVGVLPDPLKRLAVDVGLLDL